MRFTCEACSAQYSIADEKVGPKGVKVRCKKCGQTIVVRPASARVPEEPFPAAVDEAARPAAPPPEDPALVPAPEGGVVEAGAPRAPTPADGDLDAELGAAFDKV